MPSVFAVAAQQGRRLVWLPLILGAVLIGGVLPAGAAAQPTVWPGGRWQPEAATYGMRVTTGVKVTMDDGAVLRANIGYPTDPATGRRAPGDFPVILTQNPYPGLDWPESLFVRRGYIHAVVTVRGTGSSQGPGGVGVANDFFGPRAAQDGVQLVDWAAHDLSGSNGKLGLYGCSFLGISQLFTAAAVGPDSPIEAIAPSCAAYGYEWTFPGGMPSSTFQLYGSTLSGLLGAGPNAAANAKDLGGLFKEAMGGGPRAYNGQYWQDRTTSPQLAAKIVANGIPALLWSGWKAQDGPGAIELYAAFQNAWAGRPALGPMTPGQPVTGRYQAVIGPWVHAQGLDLTMQLEWFDTWLKGQDTGMAETQTPLHVFEGGSQRWVNAATHPATDRYTSLHLRSGEALTADQPAADESPDSLTWAQPSVRGAALTYDSAPLADGATLAGPVAASIFASSTRDNLQLTATLLEVLPGGATRKLSQGFVLGSLSRTDPAGTWLDRDGRLMQPAQPFSADEYVPRGLTHRYDLKLLPVVHALQPGSRLRLRLTSQTNLGDCFDLLGIPKPCAYTRPQNRTLTGGKYAIQHRAGAESVLTLPLLGSGALSSARAGRTRSSGGAVVPLGW